MATPNYLILRDDDGRSIVVSDGPYDHEVWGPIWSDEMGPRYESLPLPALLMATAESYTYTIEEN